MPTLLETKLFIPRLQGNLVQRSRLVESLELAVQRALTLVSAPAGFGKTTALAEWIASVRQGPPPAVQVAWLSLDREDNDPQRFCLYLAAALERAGQIKPFTYSGIASAQNLPAQTVLIQLINELAAAGQPCVLVLDDYHLIDSPAVHQCVVFLLEHRPPNLHLILLTRADPPIPVAGLRGRGELAEIRADLLRFTPEETAAYFQSTLAVNLDGEELALLEARIEGWAAGLQMASVALQARLASSDRSRLPEAEAVASFIGAFSGSHRFILDYLVEEVLSHQPERTRTFLLQTSILDRLAGPLCAWVTGFGESRDMLEHIARSNLFLLPLDDERRWFRYHHLFADLLRAGLEHEQPERIPTLHTRAAGWFARNGYPHEAVQHAIVAQDWELAAVVIEEFGQDRWSSSDLRFLSLVERLPAPMLCSRPRLGILRAWMLFLFGRLPAAEALLHEMLPALPADSQDPALRGLRAFVDLLFIYLAVLTDQTRRFDLPESSVLASIPEHWLGMRNSAEVIYAYLLAWQGDFEPAIAILAQTVQRDTASGGTTALAISTAFIARLHFVQGRLSAAAELCRDALKQAQDQGAWRFYNPGLLNIELGEVLRERDDLQAAESQILEGLRVNESWNTPHAAALGLAALSRVQLARGDPSAAAETLSQLERMVQDRAIPPDTVGDLNALRVRLWLAAGDLEAAGVWAAGVRLEHPPLYLQEADGITKARLLVTTGSHAEAAALLDTLLPSAEAGGRKGRLLEIYLLRAIALAALGRTPAALQALDLCLSIAEPEGYRRIFLDEGEPVQDLLQVYQRSPDARYPIYARKLLQGFGEAGSGAEASGQARFLVEPLTERELEVLSLICAGDSNKTISEKLVVTLSTVKKHAGNIYGKLGVSSRTQAIARARELGLEITDP